MRVALPTWRGRISPVFDVARDVVLVDTEAGRELGRREASLDQKSVAARAKGVADLGADVLICGAISWPLEMARWIGPGMACTGAACG